MQPLSEKAKGKQRADPIQQDGSNPGGPVPPRQLMVRFTEGVQDLVLHVADQDSVRDIKDKVCMPLRPCVSVPYASHQIREARPKLQRRRMRLIHAGRLLADGTQLASWLGTLEERQQRTTAKVKDDTDSSVSSNNAQSPPSSAAAAPLSVPWLHCSVGAQLSDGEEDGEVQPQVRPWQCSISISPFSWMSDVPRLRYSQL
jgi:hypothetical protein